MAQRTLLQRLAFPITQQAVRLAFTVFFQGRCRGRENYPRAGGALVCSNHQSNFDPVLIGLTCDRRLNYLAKKSLFRIPLFGPFIRFWDAIPVDRSGKDIAGLKESLRRLKRGEMLLVFPEGTRTRDGKIAPLKSGFCTLARRAKVPIVPVGFDGPYHAWPRENLLPRLAKIHVCIGEPISTEAVQSLNDDQLTAELEARLRQLFEQAQRSTRPRR